ncbi:MAG: hypothetical protein ACYC2K_03290 [Gemmatimonadales bacterium]
MTDFERQDLSEVESLLASRQQLTGWLEKIDAAGSKTPPGVRHRVRTDYEARLAQVVQSLRGHSDVIASSLEGLRSQAREYHAFRSEEEETLAEAELRHSVGEYSEAEWQRVAEDCGGKIGGLNEELDRLAGEIGRLEEVLSQIVPVPTPEPEPVIEPVALAAEPEPTAEVEAPVVLSLEEEPAEPAAAEASTPVQAPAPIELPEAPRFVPRGGLKPRESGPTRAIPFPSQAASKEPLAPPPASSVDELTFLKSMTLDPRNAAGQATTTVPEVRGPDRPAPTSAKTLKCGECGSLNRPTEWYCERCGAELAAV